MLSHRIKVNCVETEREHDGLAMSSRNRYLSAEQRVVAPILYRALSAGARLATEGGRTRDVLAEVARVIAQEQSVTLQYVNLCDGDLLQDLDADARVDRGRSVVLASAISVGSLRLLDNIVIRR